jgi:hypothetical protein
MRHRGIAVGLAACLGVLAPATGVAGPQVPLGDPVLDLALRQAGWEVRRAEGGGLLLTPPQASQQAGASRDEVQGGATAKHASPAVSAPDAGAGDVARGAGRDWDRLRGLGWRVEQGSDGSTLLYPPMPKARVSATQVAPAAEPEKALDALLQERGWRVERDAKGALLLHPRGPAPARPGAATYGEGLAGREAGAPSPEGAEGGLTPAQGAETAPVRDANIALPVDRWVEARTIAEAWLAEHGAPGWRVGKIRQVHRVYMVSIVDAARPPRVVHQIAITSGNGLVVVLN